MVVLFLSLSLSSHCSLCITYYTVLKVFASYTQSVLLSLFLLLKETKTSQAWGLTFDSIPWVLLYTLRFPDKEILCESRCLSLSSLTVFFVVFSTTNLLLCLCQECLPWEPLLLTFVYFFVFFGSEKGERNERHERGANSVKQKCFLLAIHCFDGEKRCSCIERKVEWKARRSSRVDVRHVPSLLDSLSFYSFPLSNNDEKRSTLLFDLYLSLLHHHQIFALFLRGVNVFPATGTSNLSFFLYIKSSQQETFDCMLWCKEVARLPFFESLRDVTPIKPMVSPWEEAVEGGPPWLVVEAETAAAEGTQGVWGPAMPPKALTPG